MRQKDPKDYRRVAFRGYSMYPFLRPGDILVLSAVEPQLIGRGDIVCVDGGRTYVTHRVVDIHPGPPARTFILKGDNLPHADRPLSPGSGPILKVTLIIHKNGGLARPRFGRPIAFLSRKNLTPGIIKGRIGNILRGVRSAYTRFLALYNRQPSQP